MSRNLVIAGFILVLAGGAIYAYRNHVAQSVVDSDAPVVAPSRLVQQKGEVMIRLDSVALRTAGLRFAALRAGTRSDRIDLRGEVVSDPDAVTVVRAPVTGRLAAIEGRPWPGYGQVVATGEQLATVSDARALTVPRGGTVTRVVARPGAIVQAGDPLLELTDFEHPVVKVGWTSEAPTSPPSSISVVAPDGGTGHRAILVGPAPEADPVTRRAAYLYRLDGPWLAARPGLLVQAQLPAGNGTSRGVVIPAAAVVQWDGLDWAWLRREADHFVRVRVLTDRPVAGGWMVGPPWAAGDSVVVTGAEQLLSEEFRARVTVGDEVAE